MRITPGLVFMVLVSATAAADQTKWEAYLALPSPENASRVAGIEYSPGAIPAGAGYLGTDLEILRLQVVAGDSEAFRLTYRLRAKADGGLLEGLTAILAQAIRPQAEMFLREMTSLGPSPSVLESVLMMSGLEYVDRPAAQKYEITMREKAITMVQNPQVRLIQEQCIALMRKGVGI